MTRDLIRPPFVAVFAVLLCMPGRGQTPTSEVLPELDAHIGVNFNVRLIFQDKQTLGSSALVSTELGPSIEFYLKPIRILKEVTLFDLDETKPVPLAVSIGYRTLVNTGRPTINRIKPVVMVHLPFWGRILATDQNRVDLDWTKGNFYWCYRNRLTAERRFTVHSYHPGPYASVELFYTKEYAKWGSTRLYTGCLLPLGKHIDLDSYYEHQNNSGPRPNQQINAAGIILHLYFPKHKE
jgi:Protein of unknown function (DUF2490)